jgi:hypothetical protein
VSVLVVVLFGLGCTFLRCEPVKARVRPLVVVVVTSRLDNVAVMVMAGDQMLLQVFVPQQRVE